MWGAKEALGVLWGGAGLWGGADRRPVVVEFDVWEIQPFCEL